MRFYKPLLGLAFGAWVLSSLRGSGRAAKPKQSGILMGLNDDPKCYAACEILDIESQRSLGEKDFKATLLPDGAIVVGTRITGVHARVRVTKPKPSHYVVQATLRRRDHLEDSVIHEENVVAHLGAANTRSRMDHALVRALRTCAVRVDSAIFEITNSDDFDLMEVCEPKIVTIKTRTGT